MGAFTPAYYNGVIIAVMGEKPLSLQYVRLKLNEVFTVLKCLQFWDTDFLQLHELVFLIDFR